MSSKINIFFLIFISLCLGGCNSDDFLNVKPRGKDVAETYKHYDGLLNSFNMIKYGDLSSVYFPMLSDEYFVTTSSLDILASDTGGPQAENAYRYKADVMRANENCGDWGYSGSNIYVFNLIINDVMNASDGTEAQRLAVQSEARVMRAWLFFQTAQIFCKPYNEATASNDQGLPIITASDTNQSSFDRVTLKDLYDFIVTEMEASCPNISNATNSLYRTEKGDAYMMLGTVYFYMNNYEKALTNLRLAKKYMEENNSLYLYNYNEQADDWISESQVIHFYNKESPRDLWCGNSNVEYYSSSFYLPTTVYIKPKYYNLFSANDRRKKRFVKEQDDMYWRPTCNNLNMGCSTPDLYTMLAECEARVGDESAAKDLLLTLRKNRMPEDEAAIPSTVSTKNDLIRFCLEERIREIEGTGRFLFDMRRLLNDNLFSDYKASYGHYVDDTKEVIPFDVNRLVMRIPPAVLKWNTNWTDND
jgi:starch-binding outer membrane protein, SusD/RagB family